MDQPKDNDFILFVGQEANFQTRSMLVPAKEFLQVRQNDYNILKTNAIKCVPFKMKEEIVLVNQLLKLNFIWENKGRIHEKTDYSQICDDILFYCDRGEEDMYITESDLLWLNRSVMEVCNGGFNHILNYISLQNKLTTNNSKISLYDSFLILETDNGRFCHAPFDTVEELILNNNKK